MLQRRGKLYLLIPDNVCILLLFFQPSPPLSTFVLFDRFFLSAIFVVYLEVLFQQFFELDAMNIIVLLLGLEVALFSSFTYSLPIAGSIQHAGF